MGNILPKCSPHSHSLRDTIPPEILLEMLCICSPVDLVQLENTSKPLREFIHANRRRIWSSACKSLARGKSPPLPECPVVQASGNYSYAAYITWIFGPSLSHCSICSVMTNAPPTDCRLRLRVCSKGCLKALGGPHHMVVDTEGVLNNHQDANACFGRWLPRVWQASDGAYMYFKKHIKRANLELNQATAVSNGCRRHGTPGIPRRTLNELISEHAKREADRPLLEKNAAQLETWQDLYSVEKSKIEKLNLKRVDILARAEDRRASDIVSAPTMKAVLAAFNRDLAHITFSVWMQNRSQVLNEIDAKQNEQVACAFCRRLVNVKEFASHMYQQHRKDTRCPVFACPKKQQVMTRPGLAEHLLAKHRDVLVSEDAGKLLLQHCEECPGSTRLFTLHGLRDHVSQRHASSNASSSRS
ncbi:hypothetical protein C8F01DRAFT_362038 [Mycena amicta]|nr:hypothetical protein C8F01DRAFT_362038 [Mycena amicta]